MPKLVPQSPPPGIDAIELRPGTTRLGAAADNDFRLPHPSVAEHHCELVLTEEALVVRDLDSMSGTYVNGSARKESRLDTNQILRIGDLEFKVQGAPVQIIVPKLTAQEKLQSVEMADGWPSCARHHRDRGIAECTKCHRSWCGHCLHRIGLQGKAPLRLCPECGGVCGPARRKLKLRKQGFFARLFDFLFGWLFRRRVQKPAATDASKPDDQPPTKLKIKGK